MVGVTYVNIVFLFFIRMSKIFFGTYFITYQLLQLFYFRETAPFLAIEYNDIINPDTVMTARLAGLQGNPVQFVSKGGQKFLCHIGSTQQPVTFRAIFNSYSWFHQANLRNLVKQKTSLGLLSHK